MLSFNLKTIYIDILILTDTKRSGKADPRADQFARNINILMLSYSNHI